MYRMFLGGADSKWYDINYSNPLRKYHKYFRQRDTLMSIPKILEEDLKNKDENKYNELVAKAKEERSKLTLDDIIKVMPESAAIVADSEENG